MILFIAAACIAAIWCGNRVVPALKDWSFWPLWIIEIAFWTAQVSAWCGFYAFVRWASVIQSAFLLSLLFPILRFRLYGGACLGSLMVAAGTALNRWVMSANEGRMPVLPTLSRLTRYYRDGSLEAAGDSVHMLMSGSTALNLLGDWIDVGFSIMSVGDLLIHGFVFLVVFRGIIQWNRGYNCVQ